MAEIRSTGEIDRRKFGFNAPCLRCAKVGGVMMHLEDLKGEVFYCAECNGTWTLEHAKQVHIAWAAIASMVTGLQMMR